MADINLTTTATVPTGTSLTVTVYEDTDADGVAENSAAQSIDDGTNSYTLTGFGGSGNDFWLDVEPDNTDVTQTASLDSATVEMAVPDAPTNLAATAVDEGQIDLSWDDNPAEDGYRVYRDTTSGVATTSGNQIADLAANTTSYSDTGRDADETYYYVVTAYDTQGESDPSNEASATTPFNAPTNLAATAVSADQIDVTWTDNSSQEDGYEVYRSTDGGSTWTGVADVAANGESYSDTALADGTQYHYRVRAYQSDGDTSGYSNTDGATTDLPAPTTFTVDATRETEADLSWTDNSTNEDGYRVYQRLTGGTYSQIADLAANTTTYTATGLLNGREYEWYVEAYTADATASSGTDIGTTVLPDVDALSIDDSVEDELTSDPSTTPALNHGEFRVEWREDGNTEWLRGLYNRTLHDDASSLTDWTGDAEVTREVVDDPSEAGSAVKGTVNDDSGAGSTRDITYRPTGTFDIRDGIQFWIYVESALGGSLDVILADSDNNTSYHDYDEDVDFVGPNNTVGEGVSVQITPSQVSGIDATAIDRITFRMRDFTVDEYVVIDSIQTGESVVPRTDPVAIQNLKDGQQYDVRARSETVDVTGTYFSNTAITVLPAPSGLSVGSDYALDFDGVDDTVDVGGSPELHPGESLTVRVTANQIGSADHAIYPGLASVSSGGSFDDYLALKRADGTTAAATGNVETTVRIEPNNGNGLDSDPFTYTTGESIAITVVARSNGDVDWYVDGDPLGTSTRGFDFLTLGWLGRGYGGSTNDGAHNGVIDSIRHHDSELSASQIEAHADGETLDTTGKLWYTFSGGSGTTVLDRSRNGNDGSLVNGPQWVEWNPETTVALEWVDNADNETQQTIHHRREDVDDFVQVEDVGSDHQTAIDYNVHPGYTYEFFVRVHTDYESEDSGIVQASTTETRFPKTRTRREEWTVEIDHSKGTTIVPMLLDDAEFFPALLNVAKPRIEIPVAESDRWTEESLMGQPIRVWYRGTQLPIDEIIDVDVGVGEYTIVAEGAAQLDDYVESEQFDERETHLAIGDVLDTYTGYTHTIDDPSSTTRADVEMLHASMGDPEDFRDKVAIDFDETQSPAQPVDDTIPVRLYNDGLRTKQTAFFNEAENGTTNAGTWFGDQLSGYDGDWSNGEVLRMDANGEYVEADFTLDYTVPSGDLDIHILMSYDGNDNGNPGFDIILDGTTIESVGANSLLAQSSRFDLRYFTTNISSSITGKSTLRFECTGGGDGSGDLWIDALIVKDSRFSYTLDTNITNDTADGPELYPDYTVETIDASSVEQVVSGRLDVSIDDTSNNQGLGVSNDQGVNWKRGSNTDDFSATFASADQQIRGEFSLSRWGSRTTASPNQGFKPQIIDVFTLYADLDDTPILLDREFSGDVLDVLQEMVETGDFLLEAQRDPAAEIDDATGYTVEGTTMGQRTRSDASEAIINFTGRRTVQESYDRVVVFGSSKAQTDEEFSSSTYDSFIGLDHSWIVSGSEIVTDPSDGTEFTRGDDYTMNWSDGRITILSSGSMSTGTTYEIDYEWKFRASVSTDGVDNPRTFEEQIPSASSFQECEQLALATLKRVQQPLETIDVDVSIEDPTVSLIEAISHPDFPFDDDFVIREQEFREGRVRIQVESRRRTGEIVRELARKVQQVSQRV